MIGFTAFKTRKPREFNYRPRFYDPEQEAWEERKKEVRAAQGILNDKYTESATSGDSDGYVPGQYVRQVRIRRGAVARRQNRGRNRSGMTRLLIIFALAFLMALWIFR